MNINCIICCDQLTPTSDVYTTPCGHIFHYRCLIGWVKKARTCPQCRNETTEKTIHRLYFSAADTDGIVETLHYKLSSLQFELKLKERLVEIYTRKYDDAKEQTSELRSVLHHLENKIKISDSAVQALKAQVEHYKAKSKESDRLCEEISNLKDQLEKFDGVLGVLDEAKEHASEMLRHNKDADSLHLLVSTLKKKLTEANRKSRQASANLKDTNNSLSCYKKELAKIKQENYKLKLDAEVHNNCTKQQQYLKKKLPDLETKMVTVPRALNIPEDKIHIDKDLSVIDLTESKDLSFNDLTESKELNDIDFTSPSNQQKHAERMVRAVSPVASQDDLESVVRDNIKNEFKRCKSSSAISRTKFRKLAPNKKLQEYLRNSDE